MAVYKGVRKNCNLQKKTTRICNKADLEKFNPLIFRRFLSYVEMEETCWKWKGGKSKSGYGNFRIGNSQIKPHRLSYIFYKGNIPIGFLVCHKCDVKDCVNPAHLFLGTNQDNMNDAKFKKRLAYGKRNGKYTHSESRMYGEDNGNSKLTRKDVKKMRSMFRTGKYSKVEISKIFKITPTMACFIINGKNWKHV